MAIGEPAVAIPPEGAGPQEGAGMLPLEEGGRVDFSRLRTQRLQRCLAEMERARLDALLLGDEANARYASGIRRLWLGSTRPWAPGCVVLADGEIHLMSAWDDGVPAEIPRTNLFGPSWNPARYAEVLAGIPKLRRARRVGVDGMTPLMESLVTSGLPDAELVDGAPVLTRARLFKTVDELACIKSAVAAAESCLSYAASGQQTGISERALFGRFTERLGGLGLTIPTTHASFVVTSPQVAARAGADAGTTGVPRRTGTGCTINAGDLVAFEGGVLYAGYEGSLARTWTCPPASAAQADAHRRLAERARGVSDALVRACVPGATGHDVLDAYRTTGEVVPSIPILFGVGLGMEPPVVGPGLPHDAGASTPVAAGMVVALQVWVDDGMAGHFRRDVVLVEQRGAVTLTRLS